MDFNYHGEAGGISTGRIFLALADELQLKGLAGSEGEEDLQEKSEGKFDSLLETKSKKREVHTPKPSSNLLFKDQEKTDSDLVMPIKKYASENSVVPIFTDKTSDPEELKATLDSMIEYIVGGEKAWKCKVCGKETKDRRDMRRHVEIHMEGVSNPCSLCEAVTRSSNSLHVHMSRFHRR